ncbi:MAG: hypothetical protein IT373_20300 [Polyangiaceae bacterium]|nr:hypothetical protein [Polyangiaceae bacterium]
MVESPMVGGVVALILAVFTQLGAGSHPVTWLASVAVRRAAVAAPLFFGARHKPPMPAMPAMPPPTAATVTLPKAAPPSP